MPHRCLTKPGLNALIQTQDFVLHRDQALDYSLTPRAIAYRLAAGQWQLMVPDVYLTHPGEPSRRQMLIAALLYAGPGSAIDDVDACHYHGARTVGIDGERVRVVVAQASPARSLGFVVVRRTSATIVTEETERVRYLAASHALIALTRRLLDGRRVLAVLSDAVQRNIVTFDELVVAHIQGPRRNAALTDAALEHIADGAPRSRGDHGSRAVLPSVPGSGLARRRAPRPGRRLKTFYRLQTAMIMRAGGAEAQVVVKEACSLEPRLCRLDLGWTCG